MSGKRAAQAPRSLFIPLSTVHRESFELISIHRSIHSNSLTPERIIFTALTFQNLHISTRTPLAYSYFYCPTQCHRHHQYHHHHHPHHPHPHHHHLHILQLQRQDIICFVRHHGIFTSASLSHHLHPLILLSHNLIITDTDQDRSLQCLGQEHCPSLSSLHDLENIF
ncbi:hypothetical protein BC829DRAFT_486107 [Chytridium lagenaria]|nr:hypothetical protein BC829DRAFT_486107 [Chytridium lagenaria]